MFYAYGFHLVHRLIDLRTFYGDSFFLMLLSSGKITASLYLVILELEKGLPAASGNRTKPPPAVLECTRSRSIVHVGKTEALVITLRPLEIVGKGPMAVCM